MPQNVGDNDLLFNAIIGSYNGEILSCLVVQGQL